LIPILDGDDYGWRVISGGAKNGDGCLDPSNWSRCWMNGAVIMLLVVFITVHNYCSLKCQFVTFFTVLPDFVYSNFISPVLNMENANTRGQ
jgi:hypothetical protein